MAQQRTRTIAQIHAREDSNIQKCYSAGVAARRSGKSAQENPYSSIGWQRAWFQGWQREDERQTISSNSDLEPSEVAL